MKEQESSFVHCKRQSSARASHGDRTLFGTWVGEESVEEVRIYSQERWSQIRKRSSRKVRSVIRGYIRSTSALLVFPEYPFIFTFLAMDTSSATVWLESKPHTETDINSLFFMMYSSICHLFKHEWPIMAIVPYSFCKSNQKKGTSSKEIVVSNQVKRDKSLK